jgi:hypothetical protein
MGKEIRFLLVFLLVALAVLVYLQNQQCSAIPNSGNLNLQNTQHFTTDTNTNNKIQSDQLTSRLDSRLLNSRRRTLSKKDQMQDKTRSSRDSKQKIASLVDNILKNEKHTNQAEHELDSMLRDEDMTHENSGGSLMENPIYLDVDREANTIPDSDQEALDELIREVQTGNDLQINTPQDALFKQRSSSINTAKNGFRKVSYADSAYRMDFNGDGDSNMSRESQEELNDMYNDALIFKNTENSTNNNFKGMNDSNDQWGNANLQDFTTNTPQTQQEKVLNLYNSSNYLPNDKLLKPELTKGFQILENPTSVNNPNLIPVLKAIPVSSVLGSKRNSTWDIRAEPPNPRMAVSPWLNSAIQPDIYASQRGCL